MEIDSRDSDTLKPPELDELSQMLVSTDLGYEDAEIDRQVESFPLVVTAKSDDDEFDAFLFASLERVGGTPCILWGLGSARSSRSAKKTLSEMAEELYRRAAITFPDEDVLVGGMFCQPTAYSLLGGLSDLVPRPGHKASGEERAWGRRLAKRFGCDDYDDRAFRASANGTRAAVVDAVALGGNPPKIARGVFDEIEPDQHALIGFGWALAEDLADRLP